MSVVKHAIMAIFMRINKFLADAGISSRRGADKLIAEGKVFVNGKRVSMGVDVDAVRDKVTVDGKQVGRRQELVYLMLHKPKGCVCTVSDDLGRKTIMDLLPKGLGRLYPVGRLDYDTEGMLIITNDGELCDRLTHPRNEISKCYLTRLDGLITDQDMAKLKAGVEIEDGLVVKAVSVRPIEVSKAESKVEISINEGKNRQIRRMFEAIGKNVTFLKRIKIGDLKMTGLDRGKFRKLTLKEIEYLKNV